MVGMRIKKMKTRNRIQVSMRWIFEWASLNKKVGIRGWDEKDKVGRKRTMLGW